MARAVQEPFCWGKQTPEFTLSFVTDNLIYGPTKNPYNLDYQPSAMPQAWLGTRMLPAKSLPISNVEPPEATMAAAPPLDRSAITATRSTRVRIAWYVSKGRDPVSGRRKGRRADQNMMPLAARV